MDGLSTPLFIFPLNDNNIYIHLLNTVMQRFLRLMRYVLFVIAYAEKIHWQCENTLAIIFGKRDNYLEKFHNKL